MFKQLTLAAAAVAFTPVAFGQTYDLSHKPMSVGDSFSASMTMSMGPGDINLNQGGQQMAMTMTMQQVSAGTLTVTEVDADGMVTAYEQEVSEDSETQTIQFMGQTQNNGEPSELVGLTIPYQRNAEGGFDVVPWTGATPSQISAAEGNNQVLFDNEMLPEGPVAVGDSWTPDMEESMFGEGSQDLDGTVTCTLTEVRNIGGRDVAVIHIVIALSGANEAFGPGGEMSFNAEGDWLRDIEAGVDLDLSLEGAMIMNMAQQGMTMEGELPLTIQGTYEKQ